MSTNLFLLKNELVNYKIVISNNASAAEKRMAQEFKDYFYKVTGESIKIINDKNVNENDTYSFLSFGKNELLKMSGINFDYSTLNFDGFFIKTVGKSVFIDGYNDRGVIYGVYDFIERVLGVKFYADDYIYVPTKTEIEIKDFDIVSVPKFAMRCYLSSATYSDTNFKGQANLPYYNQMKFNADFIQPHPEDEFGGGPNMYGRGMCHNFHLFVPIEKYKETNPEFYYYIPQHGFWTIDLLNGITESGDIDNSMDVSVLKVVIEEMKKDIISHPNVNYFVFEQEDGPYAYPYESGSKKDNILKKYGRSGILVRFCNVVAKEIQKWADEELNGRKIFIVTAAYSYTLYAPVKEKDGVIVPIDDTCVCADNLVIELCLMGNRYYSIFSDKQDKKILDSISGWKAVAKRFMLWLYETDNNEFLWYMPFMQRIEEEIQGVAEKLGSVELVNVSAANIGENLWQEKLKSYIYSKLLWNPYQDVKKLREEYISGYYQMAAPAVQKFVEMFDEYYAKMFKENPDLRMEPTVWGGYREPKYHSAKFLEQAIAVLDEGLDAIEKSSLNATEKEQMRAKIYRVQATPKHMMLVMYEDLYPLFKTSEKAQFAKQHFRKCHKYGITLASESWYMREYELNYWLNNLQDIVDIGGHFKALGRN